MKSTSSKGKSPRKVKKAGGSGGIVTPKGAIVVNQGLKKIKLEEDYVDRKPDLPISMETEEDATFRATSSDAEAGGEAITEQYEVPKVEVHTPSKPMSAEETPAAPTEEDAQDHDSLIAYPEEIKTLKRTVKQLTLQMTKQNDVIAGMKSLIRNIGLSITTYFNDCEKHENSGCHGTHEEFPGNNSRFTAENSLVLERPSGGPRVQHEVSQDYSEEEDHRKSMTANVSDAVGGSDTEIPTDVSSHQASPFMGSKLISEPSARSGQSIENGDVNVDGEDVKEDKEDSSESPETSSNETGLMAGQNAEDQEDGDLDDDNDNDADVQDNDDDSLCVPDDSEEESDNALENEQDWQEIQLKSTKLSSKTIKGSIRCGSKSTANSEGRFPCSKCGKNYKSKGSLSVHLHYYHSRTSQQFKCTLCPRVFKNRSGLFYHNSSYHEHVRYKCAHCPGTFTDMSQVARHEKRVHSKGGPPRQECKICGIHLVKSEKSLQNHMSRMHKSEAKALPKERRAKKKEIKPVRITKKFQCQLCPRSFPEKKDLSCHLSHSHGNEITEEADEKK